MDRITKANRPTFRLAQDDVPSAIFGGTLHLTELLRSQYKDASDFGTVPGVDGGEDTFDNERWVAAIFAYTVTDPETGETLYTPEEALQFTASVSMNVEMDRIAGLGLALSEAGPGAMKSPDSAAAA